MTHENGFANTNTESLYSNAERQTMNRTRLVYLLLLIAVALCIVFFVVGCISTGFSSKSTEVLEAGHTVTSLDDKGKVITTVYAPRTKVTERYGHYDDTRAMGQAAGQMLGDFGGLGGILQAIPTGGYASIGLGLLGLLGIAHRSTVKAAVLKGQDQGYTQHQLESGEVVSPVTSQPVTGATP